MSSKSKIIRAAIFLLAVTAHPMLHAQDTTTSVVRQKLTVRGTVKSVLNAPLPGATISMQKSGASTTANEGGNYAIQAIEGDSLLVSSVGFKPQSFIIRDRIVIDITMEAVENSLNDVVVVGFGQQRKVSLVGAQSTVNVEDLKQPVANLSASLAGRISGLVGVQRSGLPGDNAADLWIRGIATFNASNNAGPLVIVDGVQGRDINSFDPQDIASFTILKDASATAVYGVAGANGVIIIKTKSGKVGKPSLFFNYNEGVNSFTKSPELADGITYMTLRNEAMVASNITPEYSQAFIDSTKAGNQPLLYPNVDWMGTLFNKTSRSRRANFSASGGSENATYYVSAAYYDESSLLKTDGVQKYNADTRFRRYNFTSNVGMKWTKTTKFDLGVQGYITNTNYPGTSPSDAFGQALQISPVLYPIMYPGGYVPGVSPNGDSRNPYGDITQSGYQNIFSSQVYTNARITQDLGFWLDGLSAHVLYSFDTWNTQTIQRTRRRSTYYIDQTNPYKADGTLNLYQTYQGNESLGYGRTNGGNRQFYYEASLNYDHNIGNKGHVTGLLLYNQRDQTEAFAGDLTSSIPYRSRGIAGRATFSHDDRYFFEYNFGYNGSENFAPDRRYGFFPSYGVGWVVSNEKFFDKIKDGIQFLKFRYSNGLVGASSGGRRFGFLTIVSTGASGYTYGYGSSSSYSGIAISDYGVDVSWSEARKQDLGMEIKVLNSKLSLIVDLFKERRTGVFLQRGGLAAFAGLENNPWGNLGVIENKGIDMTLETQGLPVGNTTWYLRGTATYNRDKVIQNDDPVQLYPYMERRGVNYLSRFGYVAEKLFDDQGEIDKSPSQSALGSVRPGDIKYKDLNGDGVINSYDQTRIGNGDVPRLTYGFGFDVSWKNWSFGLFMQGVANADRQLVGDGIIPFNNSTGADRSNLFAAATDRWTEENPNPNALYPRLAYGGSANSNNAVTSSWWIKDISFLRIKTLDLGYTIPTKPFKQWGLKSARAYVQGVNLFYFSKFKLWDPELNSSNGAAYPNVRTVSIGLQANF